MVNDELSSALTRHADLVEGRSEAHGASPVAYNDDEPLSQVGRMAPSADALAQMIEGEIIPRLLLSHCPRPHAMAARNAGQAVEPLGSVEHFARMAVQQDTEAMLAHVDQLMARGAMVEDIYVDLLAPTARRLGAQWDDDDVSFADVSIALCRLRQLFESLRSRSVYAEQAPESARAACFSPVPGEQHTFGLAVVEHYFHCAGWRTHSEPVTTREGLLTLVRDEAFDVIGLTLSCDNLLEQMPVLIRNIRRVSKNPDIKVMLGGTLISHRPDIAEAVGADAAVNDAQQAVEQAEVLVRRMACRT
jgi:methanogenic corrinoid protein MtbC1